MIPGGSGGASPPVRHRELSDESGGDGNDLQSDEPSLEEEEVHVEQPEEPSSALW